MSRLIRHQNCLTSSEPNGSDGRPIIVRSSLLFAELKPRHGIRRINMTDYEADNPSSNSSSPPNSAPVGHSWNWLRDRLPLEGTQKFGNWMQSELDALEATHAASITARSLKRDLRHEFTSSKRNSQSS